MRCTVASVRTSIFPLASSSTYALNASRRARFVSSNVVIGCDGLSSIPSPADDPSALDAGACLRRLDAQTEAIAAAMAAGRWREVVERSQEVASEAWERRRRLSRRAEDAASELLFEFRAREAVALRHVANGLLEMGMLEQSARCCEILLERARELTPLNVPAATSGAAFLPLLGSGSAVARWLSRAQSRVGSGPFFVRCSLVSGCRALLPSPLAKARLGRR